MNDLRDVTLDVRYSAIGGYAENDLDETFAPELDGLDRGEIREWYNGYSWLGEDGVYNPFGIPQPFDRREFGAWWFESGTPTFLVDPLKSRGVFPVGLEGMEVAADALSAFDVDGIEPEALLFQTGYLTIADWEGRAPGPATGSAIPTGRCGKA